MRVKSRFLSATVGTLKANSRQSGIVVMTSGTAVVSVTATNIKSGDIIIAQPYMYASALAVGSFNGVAVSSVSAGRFTIVAIASKAPVVDMPIAWFAVRR